MEGVAAAAAAPPPTGYQQFMEQGLGMKVAPGPVSGPNPTVAGILAGFFPFGVGAVYTGQYAKGLAHLIIVASLFAGAIASGNRNSDGLTAICVLSLIFFYVYQIIDSVRSAKAIQMAQPVPDPFGLASTFGGGAKIETSKIPMGAIVLILLGVLFLLNTMGLEFGIDRFWPLILIFVGGWLFARNWGLLGPRPSPAQVKERLASRGYPTEAQNVFAAAVGCQCARCRTRRIMGPAMLLTIGFLFLLENLHESSLGFHRTWPVILLVIGAVKLMQGSASVEGHIPALGAGTNAPIAGGSIPPVPPVPPVPVPPTSEVNRG
jgi:uncharacterized integral membrane protein